MKKRLLTEFKMELFVLRLRFCLPSRASAVIVFFLEKKKDGR